MSRLRRVATIKSIHRYPVKSMAGESLAAAELRWHGIVGDRRYAFVRAGVNNGMPWLTASKVPELVLYRARVTELKPHALPTVRVQTPDGADLEVDSEALRQHVSAKFGSDVNMMGLYNGIFDDAPISIISTTTITNIEKESGVSLDPRRFRPNILIDPVGSDSLDESSWIGRTIVLGDHENSPAVAATLHDIRCTMVNIDPDSAALETGILRAIARSYNNCAGVYATVLKMGTLVAGESVYLTED